MGLLSAIRNYQAKRQYMQYAKVMNGTAPVFTSFGQDVYKSDIVQGAIRCITKPMSKLQPRHIRTDQATGLQSEVNDEINRLLKFGPNPYMTTSDFLEKIVYLRERDKNAYIYPAYERVPLPGGKWKKRYTGFYPLNPLQTEIKEEEETGRIWIEFTFVNGYSYTMPYGDIIHWRKDFTENDYLGGNINGQPENSSELKLLEADNVITQGISKAIKASLTVRGLVKINKMLDDEKQEDEREKFEKKMNEAGSGILAIDLKNEFIPITLDPKVIDKDTVETIIKRILANHDVPFKIWSGEFSTEDYQSFYEKTLEGDIISLGRAFSKTLFTERELELGNETIFYNQGLQYSSTENKIKALDIITNIGAFTDNQVLGVFGYPPFDGGDIRHISLNYINRDIADQYQLSKNKGKESEKNG